MQASPWSKEPVLSDADAHKAREERLAAALRSNLARRKAKLRAGQERSRTGESVRGEAREPAANADVAPSDDGVPGDPRP